MSFDSRRNGSSAASVALLVLVALLAIAFFLQGTPKPDARMAAPAKPDLDSRPLEVHFINVGQGDSELLLLPGGGVVLIDTGPDPTRVADYLKAVGVKQIDYLFITHPHSDHIGGVDAVLSRFPVKIVYDSRVPATTSMYVKYLERLTSLLDRGEIQEVRWGRRGDILELEPGVNVRIYNPKEPLPADPNDASIVLRVSYGSVSIFFAGDIGSDIEREILAGGETVRSTVLKVAHHGSSSSTSATFLSAVAPKVAVTSQASGNAYGHPSGTVLSRLEYAGTKAYRTDVSGTVKLVTDGKQYVLEVQK